MSAKKVLLFIVEGVTDRDSLGFILSRLIDEKAVRFHIIGGDLTTNCENVWENLQKQVNLFLHRYHYRRSDLCKIVQLTDTDGVFIEDDRVTYAPVGKIRYFADRIETPSVESIVQRNHNKSAVLRRLSRATFLGSTPYEIFYFSHNIEHVLHGVCDTINSERKLELADLFAEEFLAEPEKFREFIASPEFAVSGDYQQTWEYITKDCNSLMRHSNFHIFFERERRACSE